MTLPERTLQVIEEAAVEVREVERKLNREADAEFLRQLEAKGIQVHIPTPAELEAWHAATLPVSTRRGASSVERGSRRPSSSARTGTPAVTEPRNARTSNA